MDVKNKVQIEVHNFILFFLREKEKNGIDPGWGKELQRYSFYLFKVVVMIQRDITEIGLSEHPWVC